MVLLDQGLNTFRDLINAELTNAQLGSDGTEVLESQTGLITAISGTVETVTKSNFYRGIKVEYSTDPGDGSGSSAREWVVKDTTGDAVLRVAFPQVEIGGSTEVDINTQIIILQELL